MADWQDGYWRSADGLTLHYRDYPGDTARTPVLCIPGLTRNARDFEIVAARMAGARRVIVADLRGRGESERSPDPETYQPIVYRDDIVRLLDTLDLPRWVVVGTSLGGIVAILMGAAGETRLAGVVLNDIGPIIEEAGLSRIRASIGRGQPFADWENAVAAVAATQRTTYPDRRDGDWTAMARRLYRVGPDGTIVADHDPAIAVLASRPSAAIADPWALIEAFRDLPGLVVRGDLSDILSAETLDKMAERLPLWDVLTLARIGHAPTLEEPDAAAAIDRLLARVDGAA